MNSSSRHRPATMDYSGTSPAPLKAALVPLVAGSSVLDLGCGRGTLAEILRQSWRDSGQPPATLYGLDLSRNAEAGQRAAALYDVFLRASLLPLPFPDRKFDTVLAVELIEHLLPGEADLFLDEVERVTRERAILTTPAPYYCIQPDFLDREIRETLERSRRLELGEFVEKALDVHKQVIDPRILMARGYHPLRGRWGFPRVVAGSLIFFKDLSSASRVPHHPPSGPLAVGEPDDAHYAERLAREIPLDHSRLPGRIDDAAWARLEESAKTGDYRLAYLNLLGYSAALRKKAGSWRANRVLWPAYVAATPRLALWRAKHLIRGYFRPPQDPAATSS